MLTWKNSSKKGFWGIYTSLRSAQLGKTHRRDFFFQVTGETHGSLWGTDVYTSDSSLGSGSVHAGVSSQENQASSRSRW